MLTWRFANPDDYPSVCDLFQSSKLGSGFLEIRRRVTVPLFLRQVIVFFENSQFCGFVTFAFLNDEAESHMPTTGIYPADWRSGKNFWVIDFAVKAGCDGFKMLRIATRGLGVKRASYFRHKTQGIREVRG